MENRKFLTKKRVLIALIILITFLPIPVLGVLYLLEGKQWIYYHSEGRTGRVVEADTNKPVEGAVVIAQWRTGPLMSGPHPIMLILALSPLTYLGSGYGSGKIIVTATDKDE